MFDFLPENSSYKEEQRLKRNKETMRDLITVIIISVIILGLLFLITLPTY